MVRPYNTQFSLNHRRARGGINLSLQGIDDIERCDRLSLGVFSVCYGITNDTLKEDFENSTGLDVRNEVTGQKGRGGITSS